MIKKNTVLNNQLIIHTCFFFPEIPLFAFNPPGPHRTRNVDSNLWNSYCSLLFSLFDHPIEGQRVIYTTNTSIYTGQYDGAIPQSSRNFGMTLSEFGALLQLFVFIESDFLKLIVLVRSQKRKVLLFTVLKIVNEFDRHVSIRL